MKKLRGKNYKRMNKKQKEKTKKTFERMEKIREKDNIRLRQEIKDKLEWAKEQQKINTEAIAKWNKNIQIYTGELLKIKGIILVLTQLLEDQNKKEIKTNKEKK